VALLLALALAGGLVGFLIYNLPPAKIYLGDCGSMMIGLTLAVLAMQVSVGKPQTANVAVVGLLLFVPLLDTTLAIVRRSLKGKGLMVADRGHVHHQLLDRGYSIWQTLMLLGGLCSVAGAAACLAIVAKVELAAWALLASLIVFGVNRRLIGHEEWKLTREWIAEVAARLAPRRSSTGVEPGLRINNQASTSPLPHNSVSPPLVGLTDASSKEPILADPEKKAA
ncbi:MAG TPA: MraY family glycosyltransferase, partial [Thermoguttaceae bacterium]|nr:MraY family glycosyltransferase [Thermoguttaceae bacterium]